MKLKKGIQLVTKVRHLPPLGSYMALVVYVEKLQKLSKALCDDKARETVVIDFYSIVSSTLLIAIAFRMRIPNLSHSRHDSLCRFQCLGLK